MPRLRTVFRKYPLRIVVLVNAATIIAIILGTAGIMVGFRDWPGLAFGLATLYFAFAVLHTYLIMPIAVCPACVYRLGCRGGIRPAGPGEKPHRAVAPVAPLGPDTPRYACGRNVLAALFLAFGWVLLGLLAASVALLAFRMFVLFPRIVCAHCTARPDCPNAGGMGAG